MPFHAVDRIDAYEPGVSLQARKLTSAREDYWRPSGDGLAMPAELVLESLLQAASWLVVLSTDAPRCGALPVSIERVSTHHRVVPGDVLSLKVRFDQFDEETVVCSGQATVGDRAVFDLAAAILILTPLELVVDPADLMRRLARMRRDPSAERPGAAAGDRLSLLGPS